MEEKINHYMRTLGLTREEAIQLIQDDADDVSVELTQEQKEVVSKVSRVAGDKDARKPRMRKPDEVKRRVMKRIEIALGPHTDPYSGDVFSDFTLTNPEREATFILNGELYKLTLSKPRTK